MTNLITTTKTMSSIELFNLISSERLGAGESKPRLNDFHARLIDELEGDYYENFVVQNPNNTETTAYNLTIEQCTLIGMRESKAVRRSVLAKLKELESPAVPQTYAAALLEAGRLALALEETSAKLAVAVPKVEYHDNVLDSSNGITTSEIAAELGMSAQKLNKILAKKMIQKKVGGRWLLRAKHLNQGYDTEATYLDDGGTSRHAMKWTEKGRKFIHGIIKG